VTSRTHAARIVQIVLANQREQRRAPTADRSDAVAALEAWLMARRVAYDTVSDHEPRAGGARAMLLGDGRHAVLALVPADDRLDVGAALAAVPRDAIPLVPAHERHTPLVLDRRLLAHDLIGCRSAHGPGALLVSADLLPRAGATVADIVVRPRRLD
jgi:hypothetical protein